MAKYYALVAGLPIISVDSPKPPFSTESFYEELRPILTKQDLRLIEVLRQEELNKRLLQWILAGEITPKEEEPEVSYEVSCAGAGVEEALTDDELRLQALQAVSTAAYRGKRTPYPKLLPQYIARFVYDLFVVKQREEETIQSEEATPCLFDAIGSDRLALEDLIASYYYDSISEASSPFLTEWFALNKNIRNILAVFTCRRLGWDPQHYLVGKGEVEQQLLTSKAADFDLGDKIPYLSRVLQIANERDIAHRERLIDLLKWQWMDEWTFVRVFDIDNVLCYYLRLGILERWANLNETKGEETFRQIVHSLKGESAQVLQDFKKSQQH
ncbi:DUF2764 family protein [Porphyromonas sp.]